MTNSVGSELKRPVWTPVQITVVSICSVINMLDGMDVLIIAFVAPALAEAWLVSHQSLGVVFSAGLAGMMAGSLLVAPFADRFGRRPVILAALVMMTAGTLGTGLVDSLSPFVAYRFLTGIGIGTLLASITAMVSEFAPPGKRSLAIGFFMVGYPVGAVATGFVCMWSIPTFGWQETLIGAGLVSAAVLPVTYFFLPESSAFKEARRIAREKTAEAGSALTGQTQSGFWGSCGGGLPVSRLFADGYWRPTLLLWAATFVGFGTLYFVTSWIPKLAIEAGLSPTRALLAGTVFNVGGMIGALSIGWLGVKRDIGNLIRLYMVAGSVLLLIFAIPFPLVATLAIVTGMGLTVQGGFSGFYSLSAQIYPADIRSAGVGWAVGVGRGGAVIGPLAGGFLLGHDLPLWTVFLCFAVPLALSGVLASWVRKTSALENNSASDGRIATQGAATYD